MCAGYGINCGARLRLSGTDSGGEMKAIDINADQNAYGGCSLCALHDWAHNILAGKFECAWCGALNHQSFAEPTVIGETNTVTPDEQVTMAPMFECHECDEYTAMMPTKVKWNANHDVYYTGGSRYLVDQKIELGPDALRLITDYTDRLKAGETVQPWQLAYWLEGAVQKAVASALVTAGVKR